MGNHLKEVEYQGIVPGPTPQNPQRPREGEADQGVPMATEIITWVGPPAINPKWPHPVSLDRAKTYEQRVEIQQDNPLALSFPMVLELLQEDGVMTAN